MINTRGRIRKENGPFDYSLIENPEYRDLREERSHASSINDGHASDMPSKKGYHQFDNNFEEPRSIVKNARNANRRVQAPNRARGNRGRNDKFVSAQEFEEVVNGFVGFLEELSKVKKKKIKKPRRTEAVERSGKEINETAPPSRRRARNEIEIESSSGRNEENEGPTAEQLRYEKNGLYRFKDDVANSREFLDILKKEEREMAGAQQQNPGQPSRATRFPQSEITANEDFLRSNAQLQQLLMQPGILQRLNWNQAAGGQGTNQDTETLRHLFEMLLSNRPPAYMNMPPIRESNVVPRDAQIQASFLGHNRNEMEIERPTNRAIQNAENGQTPFQTPFRRACTHVALAYFIYMKSLDNDSARPDSFIDPTLNARRLKEQKNLAIEADYHHGNFAIDPRAFADHMQLERQQINNEERKKQKNLEQGHDKSQSQINQQPINQNRKEEEKTPISQSQDKITIVDDAKQEDKARTSQMDIEDKDPKIEKKEGKLKIENSVPTEQKSPIVDDVEEEHKNEIPKKEEELAEVNEVKNEKIKEEAASIQQNRQNPVDTKVEAKNERFQPEANEKIDESQTMVPEDSKPRETAHENDGKLEDAPNEGIAKKEESPKKDAASALIEEDKALETNLNKEKKDVDSEVEEGEIPSNQLMETEPKNADKEKKSQRNKRTDEKNDNDPQKLIISHESLRTRPRRTGYNRFEKDIGLPTKTFRQSSYQLEGENSPLKFKIFHNTKPKNESSPQENPQGQQEPENPNQDNTSAKQDRPDRPRRVVAKK